jgi:hypothetical protein
VVGKICVSSGKLITEYPLIRRFIFFGGVLSTFRIFSINKITPEILKVSYERPWFDFFFLRERSAGSA